MVYRNLPKEKVLDVTLWKLVAFLSPLMLVLSVQRISRPLINLLVARSSSSETEATKAVAVLTASYPLGHLPYGWLNQVRPVSPAFQKKNPGTDKPVISGKKIGLFIFGCLVVSATTGIILFWIPGVSLAILENVIEIPPEIAGPAVNVLRVFSFFCYTVAVRASLTGWLTLHRQTKLVMPSAIVRMATIVAAVFVYPLLGATGALLGVMALFSGFFIEMWIVVIFASAYGCWRYRKGRRAHVRLEEERSPSSFEMQSMPEQANNITRLTGPARKLPDSNTTSDSKDLYSTQQEIDL